MSCPLTFCYSCISIMVACERVPKDNGFPSQTCSFRKGVARADAADAKRKKSFVLKKSMAKFEIRNFDHFTLPRKWCCLVRKAAFVFAVRFHVMSTQTAEVDFNQHACPRARRWQHGVVGSASTARYVSTAAYKHHIRQLT